ncbi:unnamed protein product [Rhodiola kirilowii]
MESKYDKYSSNVSSRDCLRLMIFSRTSSWKDGGENSS